VCSVYTIVQAYIIGVYICVAFNVVSIGLLLPAIVIFCTFRSVLSFSCCCSRRTSVILFWLHLRRMSLLCRGYSYGSTSIRRPLDGRCDCIIKGH